MPLLIRAPFVSHSVGRRIAQPVELIDVFVTLADLSGAMRRHALPSALEGETLAPLLAGAPSNESAAAFTLYPRWRQFDDHSHCFKPYEAIEAIRAQDRFAELPVIALTAKAMPEDRRKCIEAGANDYLGKPVDVDRLLSVIRVWLGRAR